MANKRKSNTHWLSKVVKKNEDKWKLNIDVKQNGHLKMIFTHENGKKWSLSSSNTPSDKRARKNQITTIKKGFKENFDIDVNKDDFSMQFYRGNIDEVSPKN